MKWRQFENEIKFYDMAECYIRNRYSQAILDVIVTDIAKKALKKYSTDKNSFKALIFIDEHFIRKNDEDD